MFQSPAGCACESCRPLTLQDMRMVLCESCGNKRCPHATDHRNACTGSNEPGQPGSSWEGVAPSPARSPALIDRSKAIALDIAFHAMIFAREVHKDQRRKYTENPYADHLAEVAGIVAATCTGAPNLDVMIAVAWLHDSIEDQGVTVKVLEEQFGAQVAEGVLLLSDLETGNRAERKAASRARLARAPGWVQTIKVADLISNTSSIVMHDPKFAVRYLEEKRLLLDVLSEADPRLVSVAREKVKQTS